MMEGSYARAYALDSTVDKYDWDREDLLYVILSMVSRDLQTLYVVYNKDKNEYGIVDYEDFFCPDLIYVASMPSIVDGWVYDDCDFDDNGLFLVGAAHNEPIILYVTYDEHQKKYYVLTVINSGKN